MFFQIMRIKKYNINYRIKVYQLINKLKIISLKFSMTAFSITSMIKILKHIMINNPKLNLSL